MSIDFVYAQARTQARLGQRLPESGWRLIESSLGLAQYLHSARATVLSPRIEHFTASVSPHTIDRSLRHDWREEVAAVGRWVPERWHKAVAATTWLPYLSSVAYLDDGGTVLHWMRDDSVLAGLASDDLAVRRLALNDSPFACVLPASEGGAWSQQWVDCWQEYWPETGKAETAGLQQLIAACTDFLFADDNGSGSGRNRRERLARLDQRALRLLRRYTGEPVIVFCYLLLTALDLLRLRDGLVRRALFNDVAADVAL